MSLTQEQKQAFAVVEALVKQHSNPMIAGVGLKVIEEVRLQLTSPRDVLEELGAQIKADHATGKHQGCDCLERHEFLMDVLRHLEAQKFNNEIIHENIGTAIHAWLDFKNEFDQSPTVTYIHSPYVIETGVAGIYFIHPAAQR